MKKFLFFSPPHDTILILMRKYIILLFLFTSGSLGFSMEVELVNRYAPDNVRLSFNSYSFYFGKILFHFDGTHLWHVSGNTFIPVLEKDEVEKIREYMIYRMTIFAFSDDYKKLFYFFQDQVDDIFLGYEIIVEEGEVSLLERSKEYIYSLTPKSLNFDYSLLNNYKVVFLYKTYQNYPISYYEIRDNNNELVYNLSEIYEKDELYISLCAVNEKKNKIILTLHYKKDLIKHSWEAAFLDECRIIYDSYITDTRVRIRSEPNLRGEVLGYGDKNEAVKILDRSDEKERIDGLEDYWYHVKKADDLTGWMYGAYLSKDFR
jgi:hypothetical protein